VRLERFGQARFGGGHGAHQRNALLVVQINADAQVDLVRTRIGGELFVQREDGVPSKCFDVLKHLSPVLFV
jgi:hypothetical protein